MISSIQTKGPGVKFANTCFLQSISWNVGDWGNSDLNQLSKSEITFSLKFDHDPPPKNLYPFRKCGSKLVVGTCLKKAAERLRSIKAPINCRLTPQT